MKSLIYFDNSCSGEQITMCEKWLAHCKVVSVKVALPDGNYQDVDIDMSTGEVKTRLVKCGGRKLFSREERGNN